MQKMNFVFALIVCLIWTTVTQAADAPRFRGPSGDGRFQDTELLKQWPEGGPTIAWTAKGFGTGYSSAAVVGDSIYLTGKLDDKKGYVFEVDLDGDITKRIAYGPETDKEEAPGSRCTPTIGGDRLYIMSGSGVVSCIKIDLSEILWQVDILKQFNAELSTWHYAENLAVVGDRVICTPGGPDAGIVALNKMTGETLWTSKGFSDPASYCSPNIIEHNGRKIVATMTAKYLVGVDFKTGELLWKHEHPNEYDMHAITPLYSDGMLYFTAGQNTGGGMMQLSGDGASITPKWTDKNLDCDFQGVVLADGYIYGSSEPRGGQLVCLELSTGNLMWSERRNVMLGAVVYADGMLYSYEGPDEGDADGIVRLVKATPDGYQCTGIVSVSEGSGPHWAHPTIAGGRLYIRRGDALIAYDIKDD